jgi:beta-mannanase
MYEGKEKRLALIE